MKRYGLVIDLERCTGCNTCRMACKTENDINISSGIRVDTIGGPHQDTPTGEYPDLTMYFRPVMCMHCDEPPCIEACPLEAIYKRKDGIVVIDDEQCTGCQECITVCPYNAPFYDAEKDVVRKCSLCAHRIDQGLEPFCVICCENEAILFGDLNDPKSKVSQAITQRKDIYNLYPEKGTKPAIYYSPMRTVNSIT